jgi:general secretion pathway protein D
MAVGGSMGRLRLTRLLAVALLAALGTGCAAGWAFRQGQEAGDVGDWDLAVARYTRALEKDPNNIKYKIALETARVQASRMHYDAAKKHLAASDLARAAEELEIAANYDPANRSASDDLALVRRKIQEQREEQLEREQLGERKARAAAAARLPVPVLSPRSQVPVMMRFETTSLRKILESLGKLAGVNVLFDEGFRDNANASFNVSGITFQEALDRLTFVNRLFYKVLDQNTIIVVPESRQKRTSYDELALRTFYLQNAEVNDTANLVKAIAKIQTVAGNPSIGAITVLGTVDQLAIAERIIESNDKARGEVVVEVQILEVNRNNLKRWGIDLSNYTAAATLSPTGGSDEITAGLLNIRAHLLSSLNLADWVVSIPSTIFVRFLQNESTARILAAPKLRAAEGKKAELKIGTEVPIPVTSYTVGVGGGNIGGGYYPATSFQYRNVGVNLVLTPRVAASGDITLEMSAEFSLLGADRNVGSESNPINVPTFLTRNVNGVLRLRDGETGLIGGLLQGSENSTFAGALGMNSIPVLGKLFGNRTKQTDEQEVVISITPRIVRAPKLTEEDLVALRVGTQEVPRVEGARPGIFGPEPEPETGGAGTVTPGAPASPPGASPMAVPPPSPEGLAPAGAAAPGPAPAPADARPATVLFSPPEASLRVGQSSAVAVVLVGARDVQWVELTLGFDPALAEVAEIAPGSLLTLDGSQVSTERQIESGRARVRFLRPSPASGSGAVASVSLRGLSPGSGLLSIESIAIGRAAGSERPAPPAAVRLVVSP